jgi:septum formation protein
VLASRSPQRRAILQQLGVRFEVRPADVEERRSGTAETVASENALRKARAVRAEIDGDQVVLGVDTVVVLEGRIYGKAGNEDEARAFLERLSGRHHDVWSALALLGDAGEEVRTARTTVHFRELDARTIDWYLKSGEWRDRAGAYAIQGRGAALVERIEGDYWNVVGLPVPLLLRMAPDLLVAGSSAKSR